MLFLLAYLRAWHRDMEPRACVRGIVIWRGLPWGVPLFSRTVCACSADSAGRPACSCDRLVSLALPIHFLLGNRKSWTQRWGGSFLCVHLTAAVLCRFRISPHGAQYDTKRDLCTYSGLIYCLNASSVTLDGRRVGWHDAQSVRGD
eukprot:1158198-Pelagomonas_calceolata.AAC.3